MDPPSVLQLEGRIPRPRSSNGCAEMDPPSVPRLESRIPRPRSSNGCASMKPSKHTMAGRLNTLSFLTATPIIACLALI
jgi:hypothetical protein